jgi:hypothetical protein
VDQAVVHADAVRQAAFGHQLRLVGTQVGRRLGVGQRVHRHVDDRTGGVAHRLVALAEALRGLHALHQSRRDRLAGLVVPGMASQHLGLGDPVLEQLRGQFDEIAQHLRARQAAVGHVGQQPVQTVAELVEQRARVVQRQQRRRPRRALGKVVVVQDHRQLDPVDAAEPRAPADVAALPAQSAHPRTAALARSREVVLEEHADHPAVGVGHLVGAHVGVVGGHVGARREAQAEQSAGTVEGCRDHGLEREVGLDLGIVDGKAAAAHLLGQEAPVPGLDRAGTLAAPFGDPFSTSFAGSFPWSRQRLGERLALAFHRGQRPRPDLVEQALHGFAAAGHGVGECVVGVAGVAVQRRELAPQSQDVARDLTVVGLARVCAAASPLAPGALAQVAPRAVAQEGHHQRARQRDHVPFEPAIGRCLARSVADEIRQAGEFVLGLQVQETHALVVQHVLSETGGQPGQGLHDLAVARLGGRRQPRAGTHEAQVDALEQPQRLGIEAQLGPALVQRVDAREQRRVGIDRRVVSGQRGRHLALNGLQRRAGRAGGQVVEDRSHPVQQRAGAIERSHRVVEVRLCARASDRRQLTAVHCHGLVHRRGEVLGLQFGKGRQAVGGGPGLQQRIHLKRPAGRGGTHEGQASTWLLAALALQRDLVGVDVTPVGALADPTLAIRLQPERGLVELLVAFVPHAHPLAVRPDLLVVGPQQDLGFGDDAVALGLEPGALGVEFALLTGQDSTRAIARRP